MGVNIGQVVSSINEKTKSFIGMKLPVKVTVDKDTKKFEIEIGTPPTSQLIKKEIGIEKGSSSQDKVADILIEQLIQIAKMKESSLLGKTLKERIKEVIGTCNSMGILIEGKSAAEIIEDINEGKFDEEIRTEKTELTIEEKEKLDKERKRLAQEMERKRTEFEAKAKDIISSMGTQAKSLIKLKLKEAGIPEMMIKELLPAEGPAASQEASTGKATAESSKAK